MGHQTRHARWILCAGTIGIIAIGVIIGLLLISDDPNRSSGAVGAPADGPRSTSHRSSSSQFLSTNPSGKPQTQPLHLRDLCTTIFDRHVAYRIDQYYDEQALGKDWRNRIDSFPPVQAMFFREGPIAVEMTELMRQLNALVWGDPATFQEFVRICQEPGAETRRRVLMMYLLSPVQRTPRDDSTAAGFAEPAFLRTALDAAMQETDIWARELWLGAVAYAMSQHPPLEESDLRFILDQVRGHSFGYRHSLTQVLPSVLGKYYNDSPQVHSWLLDNAQAKDVKPVVYLSEDDLDRYVIWLNRNAWFDIIVSAGFPEDPEIMNLAIEALHYQGDEERRRIALQLYPTALGRLPLHPSTPSSERFVTELIQSAESLQDKNLRLFFSLKILEFDTAASVDFFHSFVLDDRTAESDRLAAVAHFENIFEFEPDRVREIKNLDALRASLETLANTTTLPASLAAAVKRTLELLNEAGRSREP